jgi:hypothetical protein
MRGWGLGFWWANVLCCSYCTLYWARMVRRDGTSGLMTGGGQVWVWQLIFSLVVLALGASPWHLLWLCLVSIVLSIIVARAHRSRMLAARYRHTFQPSMANSLQEESWIEITAANYLANEMSKTAFFDFVRESPALKKAFHNRWGETLSPTRPLTRGRLTIMFNDVGVQLAGAGDSAGAARSFACASLFIKGNPLTWASIAQVECSKEDRVAATWANKVLDFRLQETASPELREFLSTDEAENLLMAARQRMREILTLCERHTYWHDTSAFVEQVEATGSYFDR